MEKAKQVEFWLRGPLPRIPLPLQPAAHALLQAREEVVDLLAGFPEEKLWDRPAGVASPGFHLQHLSGVLDRLFTYARGEALRPEQLEYLSGEGRPGPGAQTLAELLGRFTNQVYLALRQLESTSGEMLTEPRVVGRARLPSTLGGLLFHAAEHTQRHTGQLLVTVKVLQENSLPEI